VVDRTTRHLSFAVVLTIVSASLILVVATVPLAELPTIGLLAVAGLMVGASRTPRDVMVKDAAPPGQIGKVFGFVSAGLPLGAAITPVPFGFLIDIGRPELVLVLIAVLLLLSLLFIGSARATARQPTVTVPAE
jgi:FSR family fosmidomycin resistance protein-like MFS transporter